METLINNELWWKGLEWLKTSPVGCPIESKIEMEEKRELKEVAQYEIAVEHDLKIDSLKESVIPIDNHDKLTTLRGTTAWIYRFTHKARNTNTTLRGGGPVSAEELDHAERYWIKYTQSKSFQRKFSQLKKGQQVDRQSRLVGLNPFLGYELLCVGGRLQKPNCTFQMKHPWIMPTNDRITELQVQQTHVHVMHSGLQGTLMQLRERFWILRGRQVTKKIVNQCFVCRRFKAKPRQQITAPLPRDRVTEASPFETTGVDFAGPLLVKPNNQKSYIALFTCAVTRAVHLELVSDLTTES